MSAAKIWALKVSPASSSGCFLLQHTLHCTCSIFSRAVLQDHRYEQSQIANTVVAHSRHVHVVNIQRWTVQSWSKWRVLSISNNSTPQDLHPVSKPVYVLLQGTSFLQNIVENVMSFVCSCHLNAPTHRPDSNQQPTAFIRPLRCLSSDPFGDYMVACTFWTCARSGGASLGPVI